MGRIHMPPGFRSQGPPTECLVYGDPLEIEIHEKGDLEIEDPDFFTERLGHGEIFAPAILGRYYAKANHTETWFHFTASATGIRHPVKLEVKDSCC